ncbi:MAG TPA: hypothetical protein VFH88_02930 [Candidatus Krumholzibacteria bacterium]|nr:hypothetical protein [Candidatus Krumholzibacteria bacterium]
MGRMRADPPRHIRDIAHLYLSRMPRRDARQLRVVVAGVNRDVMPGFHVANLALAAVARGFRVRIADISGLAANAGCFMALDPCCWAAGPKGHTADVVAFSGVTFALTLDGGGDGAPVSSDDTRDRIEMVHVPPWDAGSEHVRALTLAASRYGSGAVLYLAESDEAPCPWRQPDAAHHDAVRRVLFVTRAGRAASGDDVAGMVTRWMRALTDPLPVVVRDPGSRLARQYGEALSNLLNDTELVAGPGRAVAPI